MIFLRTIITFLGIRDFFCGIGHFFFRNLTDLRKSCVSGTTFFHEFAKTCQKRVPERSPIRGPETAQKVPQTAPTAKTDPLGYPIPPLKLADSCT